MWFPFPRIILQVRWTQRERDEEGERGGEKRLGQREGGGKGIEMDETQGKSIASVSDTQG